MLDSAARGDLLVVQPGTARAFWQPVPANGSITVDGAPGLVGMEQPFGFGTQTLPPGGFVREHLHDRNEELIHVISGTGRAVLDGVDYAMAPGLTIFLGRNRTHKFINEGSTDLHWAWLIVPNGLEQFFEAIGRPKYPGEAAPAPFARPADVLEIERRTVFGVLDPDVTPKPPGG